MGLSRWVTDHDHTVLVPIHEPEPSATKLAKRVLVS